MAGDSSSAQGTPRRALLGELLVQARVITAEQLAEVLSAPRVPGKKLGQVLLERGWITEAQLTQTLSLQLMVPWVSLNHVDFSRQLLNRVSRELAEQYCLVPIFVRHVKGQGETLYVAVDDPTNEAALAEVSRSAGLPTRPMIASASDIRSAIRLYYGGEAEALAPPTRKEPITARDERASKEPVTPTPAQPTIPEASRLASQPPRAASQPPPAAPRAASQPPKGGSPPHPSSPSSAEAPPTTTHSSPPGPLPADQPSAPARRRPGKMVSLTLLDGTTIQLPAQKKGESGQGLTARDYVSALRAAAHGADASEILGETPRWEPVVAALLSVLLRKGLIADREFIEELRKV